MLTGKSRKTKMTAPAPSASDEVIVELERVAAEQQEALKKAEEELKATSEKAKADAEAIVKAKDAELAALSEEKAALAAEREKLAAEAAEAKEKAKKLQDALIGAEEEAKTRVDGPGTARIMCIAFSLVTLIMFFMMAYDFKVVVPQPPAPGLPPFPPFLAPKPPPSPMPSPPPPWFLGDPCQIFPMVGMQNP